MAAVRHTVRNTFGGVIPESLHDKLMDSGFFDHEDEDFDGPQGETQDFFKEPDEEEESDDQDFFEEPDEEEESEDQDFFDEPEDDKRDEPEDEPEGDAEAEDDEPRDEDGAQRAADAAPANGRAEAPGDMDVLSDTPRRRRRTRRSSKVDSAE